MNSEAMIVVLSAFVILLTALVVLLSLFIFRILKEQGRQIFKIDVLINSLIDEFSNRYKYDEGKDEERN